MGHTGWTDPSGAYALALTNPSGGTTGGGLGGPSGAGTRASGGDSRLSVPVDTSTFEAPARSAGTFRRLSVEALGPENLGIPGVRLLFDNDPAGGGGGWWVFDAGVPYTPPEPDLAAIFDEVRRIAFGRVPWPRVEIQVNPSPIGLVGLPSHYWVTGYAGEPLSASASRVIPADIAEPDYPISAQFPADHPRRRDRLLTITVNAWPLRYQWDFGDGRGTSDRQSLGRPFSLQTGQGSDVVYQYEVTSRRFEWGYPVSLEATFGASYTIDFDGASETRPLSPVPIRYWRRYPVQEIQSVRVGMARVGR